MDTNRTFDAGDFLIIETGEYSDKQWDGPVRVLQTFTMKQAAERFRQENPVPEHESSWRSGPDPSDFLPWLVKVGLVEHVENCHSWHVGSYGDFEP